MMIGDGNVHRGNTFIGNRSNNGIHRAVSIEAFGKLGDYWKLRFQ